MLPSPSFYLKDTERVTMNLQLKCTIYTLLFAILTVGSFYIYDQQRSNSSIEKTMLRQGQDMRNLIMATRRVYHRQFLDSKLPLNELTLGFLPAHALSRISRDLPHWTDNVDLYFNNVSLNPRRPANLANAWQKEAINYFEKHPQVTEHLAPLSNKDGAGVSYHYSTPIYVEEYCLKCHGAKEDAPLGIRQNYSSAFDLHLGQLRGILSIRLPAGHLVAEMTHNRNTNVIFLLACIFGAAITLFILFRHILLSRLGELWTVAQKQQTTAPKKTNFNASDLDSLVDSIHLMSNEMDNRNVALSESHEFSTIILNSISDAVAVIDPKTKTIISVNPAFLQLYNVEHDAAIGAVCQEITNCHALNGEEPDKLCPGDNAIESRQFCRCERFSEIDGDDNFYDVCASPIINTTGEVVRLVRVSHNITDVKKQEQKMHHLAYHDGLTGLPNRLLFNDRLKQALLQSTRENSSGFIAFIDLDNFKIINDTFGHGVGDELLKEVGARLSLCVRESDTIARMGGDEFLVIFRRVSGDDHARILAEQLLNAISKPMTLLGTEVRVSASVGMCSFPKHGHTVDALLKCADNAMYKVKHDGGNNYHFVS